MVEGIRPSHDTVQLQSEHSFSVHEKRSSVSDAVDADTVSLNQ